LTIEFHCPHCGKILRTPDDKAGVRANCPGCSVVVTVPKPITASVPSGVESAPSDSEAGAVDQGNRPEAGAGEIAAVARYCPMCGAEALQSDQNCRRCGEALFNDSNVVGSWKPSRIDLENVLEKTWDIYKKHFGMLLAGFLVVAGILFATYFGLTIIQNIVVMVAAGAGKQARGPGQIMDFSVFLIVILVSACLLSASFFVIALYLLAGMQRFVQRVVFKNRAEIAEIFTGGPYLMRFIGGSLLFSIMIAVGSIAFVIPGLALGLMFWPYLHIITDRQVGVMESFERSRELTRENLWSGFMLLLLTVLINLGGLMVVCVGLVFTVPFTMLMHCVAYSAMSGQISMPRQ
jgi:predicted RNA-binding Zn-ribbon protein involved in translation (DUF1610 family)